MVGLNSDYYENRLSIVLDVRRMNDQELLNKATTFDEKALGEIYDRYNSGLYRYAMRLIGDVDLAEDCVAETFSRFLMALHRGNGPRNFLKAYLYRIAHNWISDFFCRRPPPTLPLDIDLHDADKYDLDTSTIRNIQVQNIRKALTLLTPDQRQALLLKYIEGWENQEIAQTMNKPVGAIKALLHRGIASLQRILEQHGRFFI